MVLSLSAKGLTHGEIAAHLAEVYGADVSKQTISTITDKVLDGMAEWQNRPIYVVLAVTVDGHRDILGIWAGDGGEGAKHWQRVLTELANRGQRSHQPRQRAAHAAVPETAKQPARHPGDHQVKLIWTASPTSDVYYYICQRNCSRSGSWQRLPYPVLATSIPSAV